MTLKNEPRLLSCHGFCPPFSKSGWESSGIPSFFSLDARVSVIEGFSFLFFSIRTWFDARQTF